MLTWTTEKRKVKNPSGVDARNWQGGDIRLSCKVCGKEFFTCKANKDVRKFCSRPCYHKHLTTIKRPLSEATKIKIGKANSMQVSLACDFCGKTVLTSPFHLKDYKTIFCSRACYGKFVSAYCIREKSANWQGGKNPLHEEIRKSNECIEWKKLVAKRDSYICQDCGQIGGKLEIHHIKSFSVLLQEFLSLYSQFSPIEDMGTLIQLATSYTPFWDVNNGKTLCNKCHNKTKVCRKKTQCSPKI